MDGIPLPFRPKDKNPKNLESREWKDGFSSTVWITRVSRKIGLNNKKTDFIIKVYGWKSSARCWIPIRLDIWMFPIIGVPQNGWFIMENPIKMADLVVPIFSETQIYLPIHAISDFVLPFVRWIQVG